MNNYQIYYVGTEDEVAHHAAPLDRSVGVRIVEPEQVARFAKPNDLAIFFSEHFRRFRKAWLDLSNEGCNTLYAIDGILEWRNAWENRSDEPACPWTMRPVLCDKVACIGASQARVLNTWGNLGKTEVVGIPRLESLRTNHSARNGRNEPIRILVTTAKWPGFTPEQIEQVVRSLQDLKNYFETRRVIDGTEIEVLWRLTGGLDHVIGVENHMTGLDGAELQSILADVDAVITTPSTVMLEAMLCELPVCLLDYTNSPGYVSAAWSISAREHIGDVIEQLARPTDRRFFLQKSLLEDTLQCNESATERMVQLANEMIRIGHDCRTANQPVEFPAQVLTAVSGGSVLDLRSTFPHRSNIMGGAGTEECNAVASESIRWINHLEQRIEEVECELARAAEGFDRIANHPVLAPLVKVRKAALNMGGRIADVLSAGKKTKETTQKLRTDNFEIKT